MKIDVSQAAALVRHVEHALAAGHGDVRSNAVVRQLLAIAKAWVDDHSRPKTELTAVFPTERSDPPSRHLAAHHAAASND